MSRDEASIRIEALGGNPQPVSKRTTYPVAGPGAGSAGQGPKLGVTVLDEPGFLALLEDPDFA